MAISNNGMDFSPWSSVFLFSCLPTVLSITLSIGKAGERSAVTVLGEAVDGLSLALEGIDHIESIHSLPTSMLSVGDGVADDVLQEHLEHSEVPQL